MKKLFNILMIIALSISLNAQRTITGTVTIAEEGSALPGVEVLVKGTKISTLTDMDGKYILNNVPEDSNIIVFSFIGMKTKEVKIKGDVVDCVLEPSETEEDDIVISALLVKRKHKILKKHLLIRGTSSLSDSYESTSDEFHSGQLSAGEVNDFGKWEMWKDITENELKTYKDIWKIYPHQRYCVLVTNEQNIPVIDATVYLKKNGKIIWTAKTDNTGKAELWANMFNSSLENKNISIQVEKNGTLTSVENPTTFHDGINRAIVENNKCDIPSMVDMAFVFDATGSMGDEMQYLQAEMLNVIQRIDSVHKDLQIRLGSVFYRDKGDDYLTKKEDLTTNIQKAVNFFKAQNAEGGGDYPEAVHSGLNVAINKLSWSEEARARIIFLVLDAPPHQNDSVIKNILELTQIAAKKGIRIVPVTCSGIDKSTEYLMRSMALATNGTYTFLTDDSGIGDSHIKPTTDEWTVELLNDLIVRLIDEYVTVTDCKNQINVNPDDIANDTVLVHYPDTATQIANDSVPPDSTQIVNNDTTQIDSTTIVNISNDRLKIYPNPTTGQLFIEITGDIEEFYVCDISGKILQRHLVDKQTKMQIDIGKYPIGIYFIRYFIGDDLRSGKVILMR